MEEQIPEGSEGSAEGVDTHVKEDDTLVKEEGFGIVPRKEWLAMDAVEAKPLSQVSYVLFGNTKSYADRLKRNVHCYDCLDTDSYKEKVRVIQDYELRYYGDIRYSFLIGADGKAFEGRGWQRTAYLPKKYSAIEDKCLFIVTVEPMPYKEGLKEMEQTQNNLIQYGLSHGYISPKYTEITMNNRFFWPAFRKFMARV